MDQLTNPVLPGFHPDPSICRVGEDYYIANSTFEWFGGVMISHSRDLIHWRTLGPALTRLAQLDMRGDPDSGGVWAPCLTYADGRFWLVYSDTRTWQQGFKDVHNYVVWTDDITSGAWSDPHYLNASGFDPSLFHDDDGRKWVHNMVWDHRPERHSFGGILLQEYDHDAGQLIGPVTNIFAGTAARVTEGSHIYKRDGWYYLLLAEGGTGRDHCVTMARSRSITGPYEEHPDNPVLTARHDLGLTLQKSGHGSLVETPDGEWWLAHLAARPLDGASILGRETALQRIAWGADGWPRLADGGREPRMSWPRPALDPHPWPSEYGEDRFAGETLPPWYQSRRIPADPSWCRLGGEPHALRLCGQESLASRHRTSLIARRVEHFACRAETTVTITPRDHQHMAGLVALYDAATWYYLYISADEQRGRVLRVAWSKNGRYAEAVGAVTPVPVDGPVDLALELEQLRLRFCWRIDDGPWQAIGPTHDAHALGDEFGDHGHFTGAMVGMACQDLSGARAHADFARFSYRPL